MKGRENRKLFGLTASVPQEEAEDRSPVAGIEEPVRQLPPAWAGD